jgi:hypothetical protein
MEQGTESFLRRAGKCQALAEEATTPVMRATYLDVAEQWRDLARQIKLVEELKADIRSGKPGRRDSSSPDSA